MSYRVVTCVYCAHEFPTGTPRSQDKMLTDHIKICEKHPMRKAEETILKLRSALIGFIGAGTKEELDALEFFCQV